MGSTSASPDPEGKRLYRTAACLIIGDEVLNGKTVDTNSPFFAKYCFDLGIALSRIETIPDVADDIISSAQRLSSNYDFVVTSGGIGPTHDDITYPSLATAFNLPLTLHQPTVERMKALQHVQAHGKRLKDSEPSEQDWDTMTPQLQARLRMATLPTGPGVEYLFVDDTMWVPVVVVNSNVYILPGIPRLFQALLENLVPVLQSRGHISPESMRSHRILISTPLAESAVAEYLTKLQDRVEEKGIKVGSYPRWGLGTNTVTLVGRDREYLESLVEEVEREVEGCRVSVEGEEEEEEGGVEKKAEVVSEAAEKAEKAEKVVEKVAEKL
ncbi:MoaB/Mog domain-containing protein [Kalaharituber pfeilii]|nr:MoaB/Mog domain-containing protein [Kalaharituber pfeilii]